MKQNIYLENGNNNFRLWKAGHDFTLHFENDPIEIYVGVELFMEISKWKMILLFPF